MSDATKTETMIDSSLEPPVLIKLRERQIHREISLRGYVGHLLQQCHRWNTAHRHLGRYSIDKLLAFDEYQRTTSWSRVAAVLVLTPIPSLLLLFASAAVQQFPAHYSITDEHLIYVAHLGWHVAWLCVAQLLIIRQELEWTKGMYQHWLVAVIALLCAVSTQGALLLVLELLWSIPMRYRGTVSLPVYCVWFVIYHVLLRRKLLLQHRQQILAYLPLLGCQVFALVFFGLVGVVFKRMDAAGQAVLSLAFPAFKAMLKRLVSHYARSLGDISSAVTVCAVEIAGSLFENVCLQSVRSAGIALLVVVLGLVQLVLGTQLYTHQSFIVDGRLAMTTATTIVESALFPGVRASSSTKRHKNGSFRHGATFTQALRKSSSVYLAPQKPQTHVTFTRTKSHVKVAAVNSGSVRRISLLDLHTIENTFTSEQQSESEPHPQPLVQAADRFRRQISIDCITLSHKELARLLTQTLQLLFLSEVLIVCEYIGCIMPFQYALYSLVVSSAALADRSHTSGSLQEALTTSCVFGLLKATSLGLIVQLVRRKYGLSALHLLAFVLEKYAVGMQGKLIACFLVMARLRSVHLGS